MRGARITPLEILAACLASAAAILLAPSAFEAARRLAEPPPAPCAASLSAAARFEPGALRVAQPPAPAAEAALLERPLFAPSRRPYVTQETAPEAPPRPGAGARAGGDHLGDPVGVSPRSTIARADL